MIIFYTLFLTVSCIVINHYNYVTSLGNFNMLGSKKTTSSGAGSKQVTGAVAQELKGAGVLKFYVAKTHL